MNEGDLELAQKALAEGRGMDAPVAQLREELDGDHQIARYAPPRRRHLGDLGYYATVADQLDLAVRNTRVLARAAVAMVRERGSSHRQISGAILQLARAVEALARYLEEPDHPLDTRHFALETAEEATAVLKTNNDLETGMLVSQIRSTAVDLLQATGMDSSEALEAFHQAAHRASTEESSPTPMDRENEA